jgi:hypothetical protein
MYPPRPSLCTASRSDPHHHLPLRVLFKYTILSKGNEKNINKKIKRERKEHRREVWDDYVC